MHKAHKIKLYPNKRQENFFRQSCGVARFSYNWALNKWQEKYEAKEKTSANILIKELTAIKRTEYSWMMDVGKTCPQYAICNLEKAYKNFFKQKAKYPKFKKKGVNDSFIAVEKYQDFKQQNNKLWIPRLGWVNCAENLRFEGKVMNITVKRIADMWFAVVNIETVPNEALAISENQVIVGVDLGIKSMLITSDGQYFDNPKALKSRLKTLKRQQQSLSRKVKGSNNRKKQKVKLSKLHYKISCLRSNAIHQATTKIVNSADIIVIEDLNVKGMVKNHNLALALSDVSFGEIRRQIEYKANWQGKEVVIADRFFASSKTCSCCGIKNENLKLSDRTFICVNCGLIIDRDLNAAMNLASYGSTHRLGGSEACGEGSSVAVMQHSPLVKQEIASFNNNCNN